MPLYKGPPRGTPTAPGSLPEPFPSQTTGLGFLGLGVGQAYGSQGTGANIPTNEATFMTMVQARHSLQATDARQSEATEIMVEKQAEGQRDTLDQIGEIAQRGPRGRRLSRRGKAGDEIPPNTHVSCAGQGQVKPQRQGLLQGLRDLLRDRRGNRHMRPAEMDGNAAEPRGQHERESFDHA